MEWRRAHPQEAEQQEIRMATKSQEENRRATEEVIRFLQRPPSQRTMEHYLDQFEPR